MADPFQLVVLLLIGIVAGFLNVMAGGGSTIVLPFLILMGLDSTLANGTNRVAILLQNISAVTTFQRRDYLQFRESVTLSLWTLPGAILGAILAVNVSDEAFQRILGVVMLGVIVSMLTPRASHHEEPEQGNKPRPRLIIYPTMFAIGFYGGFIQAGVGFLFMAALYHLLNMSLLRVNIHKVLIVMIYTLPSLVVFSLTGNVNWMIGLILGIGSALGGWWSAHVSIKKGERFIRLLLIVAILIMSLKLFGVI